MDIQTLESMAIGFLTLVGFVAVGLRWGWARAWKLGKAIEAVENNTSATTALTTEFAAHRADVAKALADLATTVADHGTRINHLESRP